MSNKEKKQEDMNLFICMDQAIFLKGPFKNLDEVDAYMNENCDEEGLVYFATTQGQMRFKSDELDIIDYPDWKGNIAWV